MRLLHLARGEAFRHISDEPNRLAAGCQEAGRVTTGGIGADGAMLEGLLARALRRRSELVDLSRELVDVADHLRGWPSRIPVAVGGWHSLSARAYADAAERLRSGAGWVIQALADEVAAVRSEIARLDEQCERLRYEILLRSVSAGPG